MKRWVSVVWAVVSLAAAAEAQKGLQNPGFEDGGSQGWSAWQSLQYSKVIRQEAGAHSGACYLEMELDPGAGIGGYVQNVFGFLKWGDPFLAGAWIRTDRLQGQQAFVKVEFFDEDWNNFGVIESERITGTCDWTHVSVTGRVPSRADAHWLDKIHFVLCLEGEKEFGRAFFDDAWIGKLSAENPQP